ncbi:MAG: sensor histidine kinase, partial [Candidatus Xenobia bacterium]
VTRKFLQVINDETNRMVKLLVSLSEATASQDGAPPAQPMDVGPVVRRAAEGLRPLADQKGLRLEVDVMEPLPRANATEQGLTQVVTNLVDNAIKFSGLGAQPGRIRVKVAAETAPAAPGGSAVSASEGGSEKSPVVARRSGLPPGEHVVVSVADDGLGIAEAEHEKIFGRFYRVAEGPGAQLGGTGLGLSISRDIVRGFGGDIQVESVLGQGATFRFTLPVPAGRESRPATSARRA